MLLPPATRTLVRGSQPETLYPETARMSDSSSSPQPAGWRATLARLVRPRRPWLLVVVAVAIVVVVAAAVVLYPAVFAE
jgi:hypothetical protein